MTQKNIGTGGLGAGKAVAIAGAACAVLLGGIWMATSGEEASDQVEVSQAQDSPSFDPYAPTAEELAPKVKETPRPVVKKPRTPKEVVITESERAPDDLAEWETEREKSELPPAEERTAEDLPPEMRKVVLEDLPGPGVYEPRLSLQKMVRKRRANAVQREMLNKLAWGENAPPRIKLMKPGNKNAKKAVDTPKAER